MTHSVPYRRMLSNLGYYNYQSGLIYRHLNQDKGWDSHLKNCRDFVNRALDYYKPEKVTVLGSGWLLELPLAEMIDRTVQICLVDIVHPPDVINQTRDIKNIELLEHDITGGLIEEVWLKTGKHSIFRRMESLDDIIIPEYKPEGDQGLVLSLNILTQLESLLISYLMKKSRAVSDELLEFRKEIQKKHIDFLKKHNSVLISDTSEVITDKSGTVTTVNTLVTDLPSARFSEEWTWYYDQTGADFYNKRSIMKVAALAT